MTSLEFLWWGVNADPDDPEVIEIMARCAPEGFNVELDDLRHRTERALIGAALVAETVPDDAKKVRPRHFSSPVHSAIWGEMLKHETFDALLLAGWLDDAAKLSGMTTLTLLTGMLDDFPAADLIGFYAARVIEGSARARMAAKP